MICFISKNYRHTDGAGDKAKTDIEAVMLSLGYRNIGLRQRRVKSATKAYFITLASIICGIARIRRGDIIVIQYPLKKYYDILVKAAHARGARVITIIHDLGSFRSHRLTRQKEICRLNSSDAIIVHTPAMRDWLKRHGVKRPMTVLGLFDYLSESSPHPSAPTRKDSPSAMFAGNLSPIHNGWLYELAKSEPEIGLILYGGGIDRSRLDDNAKAMGYMDSDSLIANAQGDYGIVWYGDSLDEGSGPLGEYLRYNAPHKTSLYLRSGLPVIIWDKAALADEIIRLDAGICVPSLRGIGKLLASVSPERYAEMRANARRAAEKLARGGFVSEALDKAVRSIDGPAKDD